MPRETVAMTARSGVDTVVLMGCSSGKLRPEGKYEPRGTVLSYLATGTRRVVANLWDVTDLDIDRFCVQMLRTWLTADAAADGDLWASVADSRDACKLRYLIGAAPVCYGVPE